MRSVLWSVIPSGISGLGKDVKPDQTCIDQGKILSQYRCLIDFAKRFHNTCKTAG